MENDAKSKIEMKSTNEFTEIVRLIEESRNRAFQKVNEELVLLYFTVGKTDSVRVAEGTWGDKTVEELSVFILNRFPGLSGFTRRGLYRMKQFYEMYSVDSDCYKFWIGIQSEKESSQFVSLSVTQLADGKVTSKPIVSTLMTQLQTTDNKHDIFVTTVLTQIQWSSHLHILNKTASPEERIGVFKDPYIFEFLDLPDGHSENDLEKALVRNLRKFILEINYFKRTN